SLLDPDHRMDTLFGVVNVPNVVWIDEQGVIVRPPEPGWPDSRQELPKDMLGTIPRTGRAPNAPQPSVAGVGQQAAISSGQDRCSYPDAIRDWVALGAASRFALSPQEVVAKSQPRPVEMSEAAAHFEIANHLWRDGRRDLAFPHFRESHRLQPAN